MKILNKTQSELTKFITESLNTKAFSLLTFLESTQELKDIIGKDDAEDLLDNKPEYPIQKLHDKVFGVGNHHIEIPINDTVPKEVHEHVAAQGDSITDTGHVKLKSGREVELSKYLPRSKAPKSVMDIHENWMKNRIDPTTTKSKLVISRHPGEVASSTTRFSPYSSCANPEWTGSNGKEGTGPAWKKMPNELDAGTMIAMHVKHDAKPNSDGEYDSKDVLGRSLLKLHTGIENEELSYHQEGKDYGKFPEVARKAADEFAHKNYPMTSISAEKDDAVYDDDNNKMKNNANLSDSDIDNFIATGTKYNKKSLLKLPNLKEKHLSKLINDSEPDVAYTAIDHPSVNEKIINDVLDKTSDRSNPKMNRFNDYMSMYAIRHHTATPSNIDKALDHPSVDTRITAIKHINATKANLEKGAKDLDRGVREEANARLNYQYK